MTIRQRYQALDIWNKIAFWGSLASIVGFAMTFFGSPSILQAIPKPFRSWAGAVFALAAITTIGAAIWNPQRRRHLPSPDEQIPHDEAPSSTSSLPPDQSLPFLTSRELIGHHVEREQLYALHDDIVATKRGHTVFLAGTPGAGCHALAQMVLAYAKAQGSATAVVNFRPLDASRSSDLRGYRAFVQKRCPKTVDLAGADWLELMAQIASHLAILRNAPPLAQLTLEDHYARGFAVLTRHVARHQPVVILLEHLDWAPPPLWLGLLRYLGPEVREDLPVLMLATLTSPCPLEELDEERCTAALRHAQTLVARQEAVTWWLNRISPRDVARYVGPAEPVIIHRLYHLSDGIAALVESLWQQWKDTTPPVVVNQDDYWELARKDDLWVFGEARDQAMALLDVYLGAETPFAREQVETMVRCAALEGITFTAQAVARVVQVDAEEMMDFWDERFVGHDGHTGLLAEAGFAEVRSDVGGTQHLNRYRFTIPYFWHLWRRYIPEEQRLDLQRRVAEALEWVYERSQDQVSWTLMMLFEAIGDEEKAAYYRNRHRIVSSLEALRWQIHILDEMASEHRDEYRLFELLLLLSEGCYQEAQFKEGCVHAERALEMAQGWHAERREVRALALLGVNLRGAGDYDEAEPPLERAVSICKTVLGPNHFSTATSLNNLALLYKTQGRYEEAEPLYQRALAIAEAVLGGEHPSTATSLNNLAGLYGYAGALRGGRTPLPTGLGNR